jgi:hypothetical protein
MELLPEISLTNPPPSAAQVHERCFFEELCNKSIEEAGKLSIGMGKNTNKRIQELRDEIGKKKEVLGQLRDEYKAVPQKVGITEIIQAKDIVRLNSEKKKFFDLLKVLSYNVQQDIVDTIRPYYKNERDVNMFVRQLLDREGSVEVNADKITVSFRPYRSKKKNAVLNLLIDKVNTMNIRHPLLNAYMQFRCN